MRQSLIGKGRVIAERAYGRANGNGNGKDHREDAKARRDDERFRLHPLVENFPGLPAAEIFRLAEEIKRAFEERQRSFDMRRRLALAHVRHLEAMAARSRRLLGAAIEGINALRLVGMRVNRGEVEGLDRVCREAVAKISEAINPKNTLTMDHTDGSDKSHSPVSSVPSAVHDPLPSPESLIDTPGPQSARSGEGAILTTNPKEAT